MKTLIKEAKLLVKDNETKTADVLLEDGRIKQIADVITDKDAQLVEAKGHTLLPGLIDVHVHLREPGHAHKETIKSGTAAAAHGGFTTIMAMPNVLPFPDGVEVMEEYLKKIKADAHVHVLPYATITKGEAGRELSDMKGLSKIGIHAFSDDGVGVGEEDVMRAAMKLCKEVDGILVAHTEDMRYRKPRACMHEGIRSKELGLIGIPSACEYAQLLRDLKLEKEIGGRYHVCHMSAKESVQYLKEYKAMGVDCSGEVTAHHLLLNEMAVENADHKMNPPLRSEEDRHALLQGLLDGTIDMIANDHAPHSEEEKSCGMEKSPFGIVSLETAFPLLYTRFVKEEKLFTLEQLVYWMSAAPAKRFRLAGKGRIAEGYDADLVLIDTEQYEKVDKNAFYSKGKNTPFDGISCCGWAVKTFVDGVCVYDREKGMSR